MATLKAGRVGDLTDSLAGEMDEEMKAEWQRVKGQPLPSPKGAEDRQILFVAIARGLLAYLERNEDSIETTTEEVGGGDGAHKHQLEFHWE
jgi:hypothetical protein